MRSLFVALLVGVIATGSGSAQTRAPGQPGSSLGAGRSKLAGTYKLVSIERKKADGTRLPPQSANPTGHIFYDEAGRMALVIMQSGRKKYAAAQPTTEEALASFTTYTGYFGTYAVNEAEGTVTHHLLGSLDPNQTAADEKQVFQFAQNRLILKTPAATNGVQLMVTWERMPDLPNLTPMHRKLVGFHKLVSNETRNAKGELLASNPGQIGYILYMPSGIMAVHMMQPNRPKYAGTLPTPQEAQAALRTYNTYFGTYAIHEAEGYVVHERKGSFNPNTIEDVIRHYKFEGPRVTLMPPPTVQDGDQRQGYLTWELLP
jgi:lipocalin-like protein